jgi:erythritol kinase (D-erythritol 1-phosphate-forming)
VPELERQQQSVAALQTSGQPYLNESAARMIAIGIEVGSTAVKAAAFDTAGRLLGESSRRLQTRSAAPGLCELDFEEIIAAVGSVIREISVSTGQEAGLLAITGQGDGLWLLDQDGHAVRPPITAADTRAASYVQEWFAKGIAAVAFRRSGNAPFPAASAALIRFLADHEPDSLIRAAVATSCKDALLQRLTGAVVTDISDASLPFLNLRNRHYDEELVDLFRIRPWRHLLPPVDSSPAPLRPLSGAGAEITGLSEGTPVHAGPFDFPAALIGAGVKETGDGLIVLGQDLACGVNVNRLDPSSEPSGMTICRLERDRWIRLLVSTAGMAALDWLLPLIGVDLRKLNGLLESSPPGAGGVLSLPFVSPFGERAPFADPAARGRIIGLSTTTTQADLARGICEGIGYTARLCLEIAGLSRTGNITLVGSGSRAVAFRQLLANTIGRPIMIARQPGTAARGAVMTALRVGGVEIDQEQWTVPDALVYPDPTSASLYATGYLRFREELDKARGSWSGPVADWEST